MASDRISLTIEQIYDAALGDVPWENVLESLTSLFGANSAVLSVELNRGGGWGASIGADPSFHASYFAHYAAINPLAARAHAAPVGSVLTDQMLMPTADYQRSEFFNDWARPQDFKAMMNTRLENTDEAKICVGLTRSSRADEFDAGDIALQRRLTPHFRRSIRAYFRLAEAWASGQAMGVALDRMRRGVIGLDPAGRIVFANEAARTLLTTGDALLVEHGLLAARRPDLTSSLRRMIGLAANGEATKGLILPRRDEGSSLFLETVPVGRSATLPSLGARPAVLLMITDPENELGPTADRLRTLYGLTAREAAVAVRAARGEGLDSVADVLGMASNTARSHLKKIFDKTETHRQAELSWLLARLSG
ncbi:HTH luxR-type domain-containing protein [Rhodovastum atsumiense]|uniref:HTH luxR-type domain-containing protein n=1 Tax=Rhodovastum atsumiense TaxID=504468 RepID=A0A5M6IIL4_9PROT|nr:hypothetical protein [Rhodovastum atsumiense]KAA5607972.1 hypothetical protein F1189_31290 [Rhodovastum atsumiense]CAH2599059.1 HTH luxR-type domain-containing protein [Rhodovastum atsumiense]